MSNFKLYLLTFLFLIHISNSITDTKKYLNSFNELEYDSKIVACTTLINLSLPLYNYDLANAISVSRINHDAFYKKAIILMQLQCVKRITDEEINFVLDEILPHS